MPAPRHPRPPANPTPTQPVSAPWRRLRKGAVSTPPSNAEPSKQPIALASLGADQAVELAPRRIDHRNRIRNDLGSVLDQAVQAKVFAHVTEQVFLRPSGEYRP